MKYDFSKRQAKYGDYVWAYSKDGVNVGMVTDQHLDGLVSQVRFVDSEGIVRLETFDTASLDVFDRSGR